MLLIVALTMSMTTVAMVTIGVSKTYSASYSVTVPSGKKYQITYRPQFRKVKVVQTKYYRMDGYDTKTTDTKISYVKIFENWDYDWKNSNIISIHDIVNTYMVYPKLYRHSNNSQGGLQSMVRLINFIVPSLCLLAV